MNTFEFVQCSKNDVPFCLMSNFVNLAKALLGSMSVRSKPKIGCSSVLSIQDEHVWIVRCSKNDVQVHSMFDEMFFDLSLKFRYILINLPWIDVLVSNLIQIDDDLDEQNDFWTKYDANFFSTKCLVCQKPELLCLVSIIHSCSIFGWILEVQK